ncbi:MAG: 6-carboxytetrahydropterin synthase [Agarilytica sp.]
MRLFVDNLTNIDFSYLHPERGLLGETWRVNIELHGELDEQSMVLDFGKVKKQIKQWLDQYIDHCLVVPEQSPHLSKEDHNGRRAVRWHYKENYIDCSAPAEAITLVNCEEIERATLARWCEDKMAEIFPASVKKVVVEFLTEEIDGPLYHYSHGLKKHDGNCQRIAHGHRSSIQIWRDGELSFPDMQAWAIKFEDIYIGSQEDCIEATKKDYYAFQYTSEQGAFFLELPTSNTYLIGVDTTVECIAQHIADELKRQHPNNSFLVKAFEGIEKGAIAES